MLFVGNFLVPSVLAKGGNATTTLTGTLSHDPSCGTIFELDTYVLFFGSYHYLTSTAAMYDYDNDGVTELIIDELLGLVGSTVTVTANYASSKDAWIVFTINGQPYNAGSGNL